ncbi:MAG TPA: hypothetical protein VM869_23375, partial [Enhygromyxa sp.]|nr:hypothetical protein [Enhygromyxa sp.]
AREWARDLEQLSRPADQVWAAGAVEFVLRKLDAGLEPRQRGNMSSGQGLALSRGEAPPDEVYVQPFTDDATGEFDYDAAMAYIDDEYRAQNGGRR